jgi:hypothetical protein
MNLLPFGHRRWSRLVDEAADGALSERQRARLERHLARCGRCRAELEELRQVRAFLGSLEGPPLPRSFLLTPAMVERRGGEARPALAWRAATLAAQAFALAGAIAFGVLLTLQFTLERTPPAAPEEHRGAGGAAESVQPDGRGEAPAAGSPYHAPPVVASSPSPGQTPMAEPSDVAAAGQSPPVEGGYLGPAVTPDVRTTEGTPVPEASPGTPAAVHDHAVEEAPPPGASLAAPKATGERPFDPLPFAIAAGTVTAAATALTFILSRRT